MSGEDGESNQSNGWLEKAAADGDLEALASLAEIYVDTGRFAEALPLLQAAAKAGHVFSAAQLGAWHIIGHLVEKDLGQGFRLVETAARAGDATSQTFLATLWAAGLGTRRDPQKAVAWLIRAAKQGQARALRQLGCLVPAAPKTLALRRSVLELAAERDDDVAQYFLGKSLYGSSDPGRRRIGIEWCSLAARAGNPAARLFLARQGLAPTGQSPSAKVGTEVNLSKVKRAVKLPSRAAPLNEIRQSEEPRVSILKCFLDDDLCDYVMAAARPWLGPATVNDSHRGMEVLDPSRTNSIMGFYPLENDVIIESIYCRIAATVGFPVENGEVFGVLHYLPGQHYAPHNDFFDPEFPVHAEEMAAGGQRVKTFLIYLNEDFSAGETLFNKIDWKFKGDRGDALLFDNVDTDGNVDRQTLHTGLAPGSGEKWLTSLWIRDRAQR